jgi:hypothetical protein
MILETHWSFKKGTRTRRRFRKSLLGKGVSKEEIDKLERLTERLAFCFSPY